MFKSKQLEAFVLGVNQTKKKFRDNICIHQSFEQQVNKTPHAIALISEERQLTYLQLNQLANQLSYYLSSKGIKKGELVGIFIENSVEIVIALLAVLKSGAAYVPLDISYPIKRIESMIENVEIIITKKKFATLLSNSKEIILIDDNALFLVYPDGNPSAVSSATDVIYALYTSGSTGMPKGVKLIHKAVHNLLDWYINIGDFDSFSKILIVSSFSFDLTQKNILGGLLAGAQVYLVDIHPFDSQKIAKVIENQKITFINCTPSTFYALVEDNSLQQLLSLKYIALGGEPINTKRLRAFIQHNKDATVINTYGPTECTDIVCAYILSTEEIHSNQPIPLGTIIQNTHLIILDETLNFCDVGEIGEGYIGGLGVGLGYMNNPTLNKLQFIENPFPDLVKKLGEKLYKTGDLLKWLSTGQVQYIGRVDHQIKIHGCRIEIEEIEQQLLSYNNIKQVAVVAEKKDESDSFLIGYFSKKDKNYAVCIEKLRTYLALSLPEVMIPQYLIELEQFPQTENKKINKKLLADKNFYQSKMDVKKISNFNAEEKKLLEIWSSVLKIPEENIGLHDGFFALGGYSLLVTKVSIRVEKQFGVKLPLKIFFQHPTISAQAEQLRLNAKTLKIAENQSGLLSDLIPLSSSQKRMWYLCKLFPDSAFYNLPIAFKIKGSVQVEKLEKSIHFLMKKHHAFRTCFYDKDGELFQTILPHDQIIKPVLIKKESETYEDALKIIDQDAHIVIPLQEAPLFKVLLIQYGEDECLLYFNFHHIIFDGWSWDIFKTELSNLYNSPFFSAPALDDNSKINYEEFIQWEQAQLNSASFLESLNYWKENLDPARDFALPLDYIRPLKPKFKGKKLFFAVPSATQAQIHNIAKKTNSSFFVILLTVFNLALKKSGANNDQLVTIPTANRLFEKIEESIGYFINTILIRTIIDNNLSYFELIQQNKEVLANALTHQMVPYEKLILALNPERDIAKNALSQIFFSFQNVKAAELTWNDLFIEEIEINTQHSRFDLEWQTWMEKDRIFVRIFYDTELFNEATVQNLFENYIEVVQNISLDVNNKISSMLKEYKNFSYPDVTDNVIPYVYQQIEVNSYEMPKKNALIDDSNSLSYEEMHICINQLVNLFNHKEIKTGEKVAIVAEHSIQFVIGLLALLKAGATFIIINPVYPRQRIEFILQDSAANYLISNTENFALATDLSIKHFLLNDLIQEMSSFPSTSKQAILTPHSPAYINYTSGSTGKPKGVLISHQSLSNALLAIGRQIGINQNDRLLATTTLSFDIALLELFMPLMYGGSVFLTNRDKLFDTDFLENLLQDIQPTLMQGTPSFWQLLIENGFNYQNKLKILCGGEPVTPHIAHILLSKNFELWNVYGPTETTIWVTAGKIESFDETIHIGKSIDNNAAYLFDTEMNLVAPGNIGELYIAGIALAIGYINQPDLTKKAFIEWLPPGHTQAIRLYKTGDRARQLSNGNFVFCGRVDDQLKVNGYRIEPAEIEAILVNHPLVLQAAIKYLTESKMLLAYIKIKEDNDKNSSSKDKIKATLFKHLKESLPYYMVPHHLVLIDNFPLNAHGKIDKKNLPNYVVDTYRCSITPQKLFTSQEMCIINIWKEMLNLDQVNLDDNFFELGGHSFLVIKMLNKIFNEFKINISLFEFYANPTITNIVSELAANTLKNQQSFFSQLNNNNKQQALFVFHPVDGELSWYNELLAYFKGSYDSYGFGMVPEKISSIKELAAIYFDKMKDCSLNSSTPCVLVGWSYGALLAYEVAAKLQETKQHNFYLFLLDPPLLNTVLLEEKIALLDPLTDDKVKSNMENMKNYSFHQERNEKKKVNNITLFLAEEEKNNLSQLQVTEYWQNCCIDKLNTIILKTDHYKLMQTPYVNTICQEIEHRLSESSMRNLKTQIGEFIE